MAEKAGSPLYWDRQALDGETRRQFDVCHGCRLCWNLCPAFPALFDRIDALDGDVEKLAAPDFDKVLDLCYQCKLCYVVCPYKPPHEFELDIPRLLMRAKAVKVREKGMPLQDRLMGNTDRMGRVAALVAPLVNLANENPLSRAVLQRTLGLHRGRNLPRYHSQPFASWFKKHQSQRATPSPRGNGKVAFFYTCFVNYNEPDVGKAAVQVLEHNGVEVVCPPQRCCGMPFLDGGDIESALKNARSNTQSLRRAIEEGYQVVVPGPTCSYMLRHEYPHLLDNDDARVVSEHTNDLGEYLMKLHAQGRLDTNFPRSPGKIAYHYPCHMKAQNIGYKSRDLLNLIPGAQVHLVDRCSAHDGTWSMKQEYFELSLKWGRRLFNEIREAEPQLVATDCPLAALQIEKGVDIKPLHPIQIMKSAYGL